MQFSIISGHTVHVRGLFGNIMSKRINYFQNKLYSLQDLKYVILQQSIVTLLRMVMHQQTFADCYPLHIVHRSTLHVSAVIAHFADLLLLKMYILQVIICIKMHTISPLKLTVQHVFARKNTIGKQIHQIYYAVQRSVQKQDTPVM